MMPEVFYLNDYLEICRILQWSINKVGDIPKELDLEGNLAANYNAFGDYYNWEFKEYSH